MSVVYTTTVIGGSEYDYAYSDQGRYVVRDGIPYDVAIDPLGSNRKYTEGDLIPTEEATEQDYIEALNELGVNTDEA